MNTVRLHKYLAQCGVASRRQSEELIKAGKVMLNGRKVTEMGIVIDPEIDEVTYKGRSLNKQPKVYYLLNKPVGFVATRHDVFAPRKVTDLVPPRPPVYPIGRLDKDSDGLLILTNDGELTNLLTHPNHLVEKEYVVVGRARYDDLNLERAVKTLQKGVLVEGYLTKPAKVTQVSQDRGVIRLQIVIKEGKKHQIRKMCHNVGIKVVRLTRIRVGHLLLGRVKRGEYRLIGKYDIERFFSNS